MTLPGYHRCSGEATSGFEIINLEEEERTTILEMIEMIAEILAKANHRVFTCGSRGHVAYASVDREGSRNLTGSQNIH